MHTYTSHFMEIQQKDNETLVAFIHHFKTAAKWCAFDSDTVAIHIFVKGLWDVPPIKTKIIREGPSNFGWSYRTSWRTQCSTPTNSHLTVSMMSSNDKCFVYGCTGHFGCHYPDGQCYGCDEFWPLCAGLPQQDSSLSNTTPPRQISFKALIHPQPKGQITLLLWSQT